MKVKVCGMKYKENIQAVASLQPDFMGFIFYDRSKRYFDGVLPELSDRIKKVGVFVNEDPEVLKSLVEKYALDAVQLHGDESAAYCNALQDIFDNKVVIIKAFSVSESFDFPGLQEYLPVCDYFLFDTKGKERGGNGVLFDWRILENYQFQKPFFLSGGIGLDEVKELTSFLKTDSGKYCYSIDVNSRFEISPGLKKVEDLDKFIDVIVKES